MKPKLTAALRAIIGRSDEIVALAENDEQNLPEIFSFRQNNITIKACLEAVDAVADSSPKELANCRGLIAEMQEHVTAANNALSGRDLHGVGRGRIEGNRQTDVTALVDGERDDGA